MGSQYEMNLSPGGYSHWHGIRICACLLGWFFTDFGIAMGWFSSQMNTPNLWKLGVFQEICSKSTQFEYNWVLFSQNWYTDGWVFESKTGIEMGHIFKIRQAHTRTKIFDNPPGNLSCMMNNEYLNPSCASFVCKVKKLGVFWWRIPGTLLCTNDYVWGKQERKDIVTINNHFTLCWSCW